MLAPAAIKGTVSLASFIMILTVKLFGPDRRILGKDEISLEIEKLPITSAELRQRLAAAEPRLEKSVARSRVAYNCEFLGDDEQIRGPGEIALIGNVCGGWQ